jgi:hypothetical protein
MNVVEDHDDQPVSAGLGEQTRDPLDEVIAESLGASGRIVGGPGAARKRRKAAEPAAASTAYPSSVPISGMQAKSRRPRAQRRHPPQGRAAIDQPAGQLIDARQQFDR